MAKLGSAKTNAFPIGTAELRVGPLTLAGKLTQANSVGLVDDASAELVTKTIELKGGFPQKIVAQAVSEITGSIKSTMREYTRSNLGLMLGSGLLSAITPVVTTVPADLAANATTIAVTLGTGFASGDLVVVYQEGKPESVSVVKLTGVTANDLTIAANSLAQAYVAAAGTIHIYKASAVALGAVDRVNYFSASLVQQSASGQPTIWNFWKVAAAGTTSFKTDAKDFASLALDLMVIEPSFEDYDVGGPLAGVANQIISDPMGVAIIGK